MGRGGPRPGSGRRSIADEENTRAKAKAAISGLYGSVEEGLKKLLQSGEPVLIRFVYEHACGKPPDQVDVTTNGKDISTKEIIFRDFSKPDVQP